MAKTDPQRGVHQGFPNPATDTAAIGLDLNALVVKNRTSTFYMRINGDTWTDFGLEREDIVVIDRSVTPKKNSLVVIAADGAFTILRRQDIPRTETELWGVITYIIKKQR